MRCCGAWGDLGAGGFVAVSIEQDIQRDNLVLRKEAVERARNDALGGIRDVLDAFAEKIGASRTCAADAMGYAHDMLADVSSDVLSAIDHELEELDIIIEREERP